MKSILVLIGIVVSLIAVSAIAYPADAAESDAVGSVAGSNDILGRTIENFSLRDFRGKLHSLSDYADKRIVVLYFMGAECPLAKLYGPRVQDLQREFDSQNVAFLGVSSNVQDSITELAAHARIHGIEFPILKDIGNRVADQVGATRTPEVFVLDSDRSIRYHGRVDAQFTFGSGVGLAQPVPQRRDLAVAIQEILAGDAVSVPATEAKGCLIGRVHEAKENSEVTYSNQISRLIQKRCLECHREGQIAPFAMTEYEDVAGWGEMIAEVVHEQRMPPWHANPKFGEFANENLLTDAEKQLFYTWVDDGCPEGDPADLPEATEFHEGWFLPREPDQVIYMSDEPVDVKAEGVEPYRNYFVDPGFTEDKWVRLAECMPGNRAVVHHIIVYIRPPAASQPRERGGNLGGFYFLAGFAPGTRPLAAPEGWAKKIPAGSKLRFEMHYTPVGTPQKDRSSIGLIFMNEKDVTHQMATIGVMDTGFAIPPNDSDYKVEASRPYGRDTVVLSLFPHMHMRGKSFRYELIHPDQSREILLDVPHYDFNWQNSYVFSEPKVFPKGSRLLCTAFFDNSEDNLANPDPNKTVTWGEQTWDEMMIGWYDVGFPLEEVREREQ